MYERKLENIIKTQFFKGKAIIIIGARQVGKTTLSKKLINSEKIKRAEILEINCDYVDDREKLFEENFKILDLELKNKKIIFIDEAQRVKNIGIIIKIIIDKYRNKK